MSISPFVFPPAEAERDRDAQDEVRLTAAAEDGAACSALSSVRRAKAARRSEGGVQPAYSAHPCGSDARWRGSGGPPIATPRHLPESRAMPYSPRCRPPRATAYIRPETG